MLRKSTKAKPTGRAKPILPDLVVKGYKCFKNLRIDRLGHVNLITGANGIGKSALLEAIQLLSTVPAPDAVADILRSRDSLPIRLSESRGEISEIPFLTSLFFEAHARKGRDLTADIYSKTAKADHRLQIVLKSLGRVRTGKRSGRRQNRDREYELILRGARIAAGISIYDLQYYSDYHAMRFDKRAVLWRRRRGVRAREFCHFVPAASLGPAELAALWDEVVLTDLEADVVSAMRIILPKLEKISFVGRGESEDAPVPMIRLGGQETPVTLKSVGDGATRLFAMALALVTSKGGVLLVDEIENGIHFSVQESLWRLICGTAARLKIQVFATTHSFDCIEAFSRTAGQNTDIDGRLIKLHRQDDSGAIEAIGFGEDELATVTKARIEVR